MSLPLSLSSPIVFYITIAICLLIIIGHSWKNLKKKSILFLLLSLLMCSLALAGVEIIGAGKESKAIVLVDRSHSLTDEALATAAEKLPEISAKYIYFGGSAEEKEKFTISNRDGVKPEHTNFELPFRQAATTDTDIFLLSDGWPTSGNANSPRQILSVIGNSRIFPLLAEDDSLYKSSDPNLKHLGAPLIIKKDQEFTASISAFDIPSDEFKLQLLIDRELIITKELTKDYSRTEFDNLSLDRGGIHQLEFVLVNGSSEVDRARHYITCPLSEQVLLVSNNKDEETLLKQLLTISGISIRSAIAPATLETTNEDTAVIFNNPPAAKLEKYTKELLNLPQAARPQTVVLTTGPNSKEYFRYKFENLFPVEFKKQTTKIARLNSAIALVIDKSRSMLAQSRMEWAKKAALSSLEGLKSGDYVTVIGFDSSPFEVLEVSELEKAKRLLPNRLKHLTPARATNLLPALKHARRSLEKVKAARKLIVVLSDGNIPQLSNDYMAEVQTITADKISLSSIALGSQADVPFLKSLSIKGKGRFYHVLKPNRLPQVFLKEVKVAVKPKNDKDKPISVLPDQPEASRSSFRKIPSLKKVSPSKIKPEARQEFYTLKTRTPVLASWRKDNLKVLTLTTDANARWSLPWLKWDQLTEFYRSLVATQAKKEDLSFSLDSKQVGRKLKLDLVVYDEALLERDSPAVKFNLSRPNSSLPAQSYPARVVGPGEYQIETEELLIGRYDIAISYGSTTLATVATEVDKAEDYEQPRGVNYEFLEKLADASGGEINPESYKPQVKLGREPVDLSKPLLTLALIFFLFSIYFRERRRA